MIVIFTYLFSIKNQYNFLVFVSYDSQNKGQCFPNQLQGLSNLILDAGIILHVFKINISILSVFPSAYCKLSSIVFETTSLIHKEVTH
jgi:hypothetical protein